MTDHTPETPHAQPPRTPPADALVIGRSTVNALLTGIVGLALGIALGLLIADRFGTPAPQPPALSAADTEAIINAAVGTAVASVPLGPTLTPTRDPDARFDVTDADNPSLGPADAPITLIEFGDFRCSFCKRFNDNTLAPLLEQYGDQVRFVSRDYPILGPESQLAAVSGECADDQGAFWEMRDRMFAAPQNLTRDAFIAYAAEMNLDVEAFTTCLDTNPHQEEILADYTAGLALGVGGTPTFFVNGRIVTGAQPLTVFQSIIEEELARIEAAEGTG
jgi:protein-disulfide isomerase